MRLSRREMHAGAALGVATPLVVLIATLTVQVTARTWTKAVAASRASTQIAALEERRNKALDANDKLLSQVEAAVGPIEVYRDGRVAEMVLRPSVIQLAGLPRSTKVLPVSIVSAPASRAVEHRAVMERLGDPEKLLRSLLSTGAPGVRIVEFRLQAPVGGERSATMRVALARYSENGGPAK